MVAVIILFLVCKIVNDGSGQFSTEKAQNKKVICGYL